MFKTVSFHLVKPCNMKCKFCYATYDTVRVTNQLTLDDAKVIIDKLKLSGVEKVTFAGGEPMLYKHLQELIIYTKLQGLTTSIITNGSLLDFNFLVKMQVYLDWIGLSIDSINQSTNELIGRVSRDRDRPISYNTLILQIKQFEYKLKINTVVNKYNQNESMQDFITWANPERWKVFDTLKVQGQNEKQFNDIKSTQFDNFISHHSHPNMVVENNDLMSGSYLLINPLGEFYENWGENVTKSDSLITHSVEHCLSQISLSEEKFLKRGGIYKW